ncbi:MAG: ScyD/ScyE family protein [Actinomycetales bacterium]
MRRLSIPLAAAALVPAMTATLALTPASAATRTDAATAPFTVVATGLDNPRELSAGAHGSLLVAEAGNATMGSSGVARVKNVDELQAPGHVSTLATGFLSIGDPDTGTFAVGLDGVSQRLTKHHSGTIYAVTAAAPTCQLAQVPSTAAKQAGKLYAIDSWGHSRVVADIAAYEAKHNPDHGTVDEPNDCQGTIGKDPDLNSNPYAVLALKNRVLIADAGGNTIYEERNGHLRVFAVIGHHGTVAGFQTVPTSLAQGRDGSIYVGTLMLGAFESGKMGMASVYHYSAHGRLLGVMSGFDTITGLAVSHDGSIFVSQLFANKVVQVRWGHSTPVRSWDVPFPAGLAMVDHQLYVSAWSVSDADGAPASSQGPAMEPGQVWRLNAAHGDCD